MQCTGMSLTFGGGERVFAQTCNKLIPGRGRVSTRFNISEERIVGPRLLTGSCRVEKTDMACMRIEIHVTVVLTV